MPTLNWIGKEAVVRHHQDVPFRLLEPVPELTYAAANRRGTRAAPEGIAFRQTPYGLHLSTTLAVEYQGADRWASAEDDRLIGGLWAALSEGRCRFVMVREKCCDAIDALLS